MKKINFDELDFTDIATLKKTVPAKTKKFKGGLSDGVFYSRSAIRYIRDGKYALFGYFGSSSRNRKRDQIIEEVLRSRGLNNEAIAYWLTSSSARHLMDDVDDSGPKFRKRCLFYTELVMMQLIEWDYAGGFSKAFTCSELQALIQQAKGALKKRRRWIQKYGADRGTHD